MASAKAGDRILAVEPPPAAQKLRRLMNLGQIVQSHALSFFHLSGPDLLLGWDSDPATRNIFGLIEADPELARGGIRLRQFGQEIIEALGGKKIHPAWCVPGGVREAAVAGAAGASPGPCAGGAGDGAGRPGPFQEDARRLPGGGADVRQLPLAVHGPGGSGRRLGTLRRPAPIRGRGGRSPSSMASIRRAIAEYIGEAVEPDSYLKSPYFRPLGYPHGVYRVGPLARLNVCTRMGTPLADGELVEYRQRGGTVVRSSFFYHYARLIEILAATEGIERLLADPDMHATQLRADAGVNRLEGVGVSEAPRGTLFHHYQVDKNGLLKKVNLIIATGQNNLAMNRTMAQIAQQYIRGAEIPEPVLNRLEAGIRAFDPCLSCSTHAAGQMPLIVRLIDPNGSVLHEVRRQ